MSESNNVKFVEANGKWMWKRYDEQGSVIFRSPEFDTEREAREDYEINGAGTIPENTSTDVANTDESANSEVAQDTAPEGQAESSVGTATEEESKPAEDNTAGTATL